MTDALDVTGTVALGAVTGLDPFVSVRVHPITAPIVARARKPATRANTCPTDVCGFVGRDSDEDVGEGFTR